MFCCLLKKIASTTTILAFSLSFGSCAQYFNRANDSTRLNPPYILVPEPAAIAIERLKNYLEVRGHFEREIKNSKFPLHRSFISHWIRDSSLRYYMLNYDDRIRHLSEWKAHWGVKPVNRRQSRIDLQILELLYFGLPIDAPGAPSLTPESKSGKRKNLISDWFETDSDKLRAALELRRYWLEVYPQHPLPNHLVQIFVPKLDGPPKSSEYSKRKWDALKRERNF